MFYQQSVWDPVLIIAQIVAVQCLFYITLGLLQGVMLAPIIGHLSVDFIFDYQTLHLRTRVGQLNVLAHLVNSFVASAVLMWIVERAKKCLDFASTCYIWHFIFSWAAFGLPKSLVWWATNVAGFLVMALLGEYLCVMREMRDIPLAGVGRNRKESAATRELLPTTDPDAASLRSQSARMRPGAQSAASSVQLAQKDAREASSANLSLRITSRGPSSNPPLAVKPDDSG